MSGLVIGWGRDGEGGGAHGILLGCSSQCGARERYFSTLVGTGYLSAHSCWRSDRLEHTRLSHPCPFLPLSTLKSHQLFLVGIGFSGEPRSGAAVFAKLTLQG